MPKLPKGLLLDLDDTILVFDAVSDRSWAQILNTFRAEYNPIDPQHLHRSIKAAAKIFWSDPARHREGRVNLEAAREQIVSAAMSALQMPVNADLTTKIVRAYDLVRTQLMQPVPGAVETLRALREYGISLILVTNGATRGQREKIERFQLQQFFQDIIIEEECGFGKPDERVYRHALRALGLPPQDVWMIGDNLEWEVAAPQRLGIRGIWVDVRGGGLPSDSDITPYRIINSLCDIVQ